MTLFLRQPLMFPETPNVTDVWLRVDWGLYNNPTPCLTRLKNFYSTYINLRPNCSIGVIFLVIPPQHPGEPLDTTEQYVVLALFVHQQ